MITEINDKTIKMAAISPPVSFFFFAGEEPSGSAGISST